MENKKEGTFDFLSKINVNDKTEKKGNLTYLSWSWAWAEVKKAYPGAEYKVKKFGEARLPYVYDEKTGYMVFTEVKIDDITHEMWLPVMDFKNQALNDKATMTDINKTIMRCLTKNLAMFGLGLYIYSGEDLPEEIKLNDNEIAKKKEEIDKIKTIGDLAEFANNNRGAGTVIGKLVMAKKIELEKKEAEDK